MRVLIVTVLVALSSLTSWAQDIDNTAALEKRVHQLEKRVAELERFVATLPQAKPSQEVKRMMEYAQIRMALDNKVFSRDELSQIEKLYQLAAADMGSAESKARFETIVTQYPKSNRAGCAQLYLARHFNMPPEEQERLLKDCIDRFGDCYYGDGTQVGPFAMLHLAGYYENTGREKEARTLYNQIKKEYRDAVMHDGRLLVSLIK
jgi:hypothetical protein